jgi:Uma2 family endonuclease
MAITQEPLTLEEFLARPEDKPALEYVEGVVTRKVAPKGRHSALQLHITVRFDRAGRRRKLARAFPELRVTFAGVSVVPDVVVYRWERIPRDPAGEVADDFREPPDIAVEIVSPGQSVNSLVRRCLWYVAHGVPVALLVDPDDRSVIVFRPDQQAIALRGAALIDLGDIVPGLQFSVQALFESLALR